jgi:NAD(P)-dependent dehydrogenase (short-subunit alcohol dehydrogenase family)
MELGLQGKSVLVTGASKGIGLGCAELFAAEGASLHLAARGQDLLETRREAIRSAHQVDVQVHPIDLAVSGSAEELVERCGDVDILVNNAGAIPGGTVDQVDEARWREAWDLKVFGYINITRQYFRRMRERGGGTIVNVIGMAGESYDAAYIAGTAGNASLMAFTRGIGSTSIDQGVRIVGVNPGAVETDRIRALLAGKAETELGDRERWREFLSNLPLGRAASVAEIANVVVFLASERASYLSGIVVTVDGGRAARGGTF